MESNDIESTISSSSSYTSESSDYKTSESDDTNTKCFICRYTKKHNCYFCEKRTGLTDYFEVFDYNIPYKYVFATTLAVGLAVFLYKR